MKRFILNTGLILMLLYPVLGFAQTNLEAVLNKYNQNNIPYISVSELKSSVGEVILLDAREKPEFEVSKLKNAHHVGYKSFSIEDFQKRFPDKSKTYVVYCSLGVRSEKIARTLQTAGYTNVKNLYGGIFEWKNQNLPVYDTSGKATDSVHAYSKEWGKWLKKGTKVYE